MKPNPSYDASSIVVEYIKDNFHASNNKKTLKSSPMYKLGSKNIKLKRLTNVLSYLEGKYACLKLIFLHTYPFSQIKIYYGGDKLEI